MFDEKFLRTIWADKSADHEVAYDKTKVRFFDIESSSDQPVRFRIIYYQEPQAMPTHADIWQAIENVGMLREEHERWEQRILQRLSGLTCRYGAAETFDLIGRGENR